MSSMTPITSTGCSASCSRQIRFPTASSPGNSSYRYYTSQATIRKEPKNGSIGRIPARALERAVAERFAEFLRSPTELLDAAKGLGILEADSSSVLRQAARKNQEWVTLQIPEQQAFLKSVLNQITVHFDSIEIRLNAGSLFRAFLKNDERVPAQDEFGQARTFNIFCPFRREPRGHTVRIVVGNGQIASVESTIAIIKAIARARLWYCQIVSGQVTSMPGLARLHGVTPRYVKNLFPCALLGPDIVEAILNRKYASHLTLKSLTKKIPLNWASQKLADLGPALSAPSRDSYRRV